MNTVEIKGGTAKQKELAHKVVGWYLKKMLPRYRTIEITVKLTNCMSRDGAYGYCMQYGDREYEIEVDKSLRLYDLVSTLTHELNHLKQYVRNEMVSLDGNYIRWKKKVYPTSMSYADYPWEKEAFRLERQLAIECFEEVL